MIEDLLDLSRIEAGDPVRQEAVRVEALVSAAVERSRPVAGLRQVPLDSSAIDAGGAWLLGDEAQLVSAVANLIDNAVKYSDAGSSVRVSARLVDGRAEISVPIAASRSRDRICNASSSASTGWIALVAATREVRGSVCRSSATS